MQKERKTPALRPILFSTEMVRAIREGRESERRRAIQAGRKTATRRVIRWDRGDVIQAAAAKGKLFAPIPEDEPIPETLLAWYMDQCLPRPYAAGDVLYVRETWDRLQRKALGAQRGVNVMHGTRLKNKW